MFDKVNMTITCTTETRERPAEQPGQAARRRQPGRQASRQQPVKLVLGRAVWGRPPHAGTLALAAAAAEGLAEGTFIGSQRRTLPCASSRYKLSMRQP